MYNCRLWWLIYIQSEWWLAKLPQKFGHGRIIGSHAFMWIWYLSNTLNVGLVNLFWQRAPQRLSLASHPVTKRHWIGCTPKPENKNSDKLSIDPASGVLQKFCGHNYTTAKASIAKHFSKESASNQRWDSVGWRYAMRIEPVDDGSLLVKKIVR